MVGIYRKISCSKFDQEKLLLHNHHKESLSKRVFKDSSNARRNRTIRLEPKHFSDLKEAIKDSDIVVNLIGILFENRKQKFYNIHSKIPEAVAKICSDSDVKKFIHVSAIGANDKSKSLYQKSKFLGEQKALENFKNSNYKTQGSLWP